MAKQKKEKAGGRKKHPKAHKGIKQEGRPNGKRWKKGLPPEKRN